MKIDVGLRDVMKTALFERIIPGAISIAFLLTFQACAETEKTEEITAEITAAQMEGRRAAGKILGPEWKDSTQLQIALMEAKSAQSRYLIDGHPKAAEAFDSAFLSTIRTVNPSLEKKIRKTE